MSTVSRSAALVALSALMLLAPSYAHAQDQRFRVSFAPAVATVSGDAELALGGSFGYRFSEHLWFEGDLTWIDAAAGGFRNRNFDIDPRILAASGIDDVMRRRAGAFGNGGIGLPGLPNFPNFPIGTPRLSASTDGSTMVAMLGIRYEFVETARFRPYLAGGLGVNNTDQEFRIQPLAGLIPEVNRSTSHTGYAFNAGVGASIRLAGQFFADVDARYLRLSLDRDIMRLGGGVSFRF